MKTQAKARENSKRAATGRRLTASRQKAAIDRLIEDIHAIMRKVPKKEWAKVPTDLSYNHDHYLYGWPKKPVP